MKRRRLFSGLLAVHALLSMGFSEGFCPVSSIHVHHRPCSPAFGSRFPRLAVSNDANQDDEGGDSKNNALLHQQIKQADPEWYQEYVSNLLGEEYCVNRWPEMDMPVSEHHELEQGIESVGETAEDEPKERGDEKNETETLGKIETGPSEEISKSEDDEEEKISLEKDEEKLEYDSKVETKDLEEISVNDDKEKMLLEIGEETTAETKTEIMEGSIQPRDATENETRAVVYRSITGKRMTCVALADILKLGYTVSDMDQIQAEFISIVVLDQRKCPSMGVPSQWKIKDPRAKPEVTIVESMEEASLIVQQTNEQEREEKEFIQQRRMRQQGRQRNSAQRNKPKTSRQGNDASRESNKPKTRKRPGRGEVSSDSRKRQGSRDDERRRRRRSNNDSEDDVSRNRRRRRERLDRDGNSRKIYRVPRDDTRSMNYQRDDPPDPESPIWVGMDKFRDLLEKEADFRMKFIGDDWSQVIEQENDWRANMYKGWLWSLQNGVGESIVPPSRYERARRNSNSRRKQPLPPPPSRRKRSQEEPRQRRNKSNPRRESRPRGNRPPPKQQQQQQRRRRKLEDTEDESDIVPKSAEERRLKRRAERRRGQPGNEP